MRKSTRVGAWMFLHSLDVKNLVAIHGRERLRELSLNRNDRITTRRIVVLGDVCTAGVGTGHTLGLGISLNRELVTAVSIRQLRRSGHRTVSGNLIDDR